MQQRQPTIPEAKLRGLRITSGKAGRCRDTLVAISGCAEIRRTQNWKKRKKQD